MRATAFTYPVAAALILAVAFALFPQIMVLDSDTENYRAIATGAIGSVVAPFSSRALMPLAAGFLSNSFGFSVELGFAVIAAAALFLFAAAILDILRRHNVRGASLYLSLVLIGGPVLQFIVAEMPDPASAALIATCLALLTAGRYKSAALLTGAAIAIREANIVFLVALVIFFAADRRRSPLILALLSGGAAYLLTRLFGSWGQPNIHSMSPALYMALKMPVNFLGQVLGFPPWTDGFAWCAPPVVTASLPAYLPTGNIHAVGFCAWQPEIPMRNLAILLSVFGVLPSLYLFAKRGSVRMADRRLRLVEIYGLGMILLGLCSGWTVGRLVSYGWPLFGVFLPILWSARFGKPVPSAAVALHILVFPIYLLLTFDIIPSTIGLLALLITFLSALQILAFRLARQKAA